MSTNDADSVDDWELARRSSQGDGSAFRSLFERYSTQLLRFIESRLGSADAEDALSDVALKVWLAIRSVHAEKHFKGWIFRIAGNEVIDRIRRRATHKAESLPDDPVAVSDSNGPDRGLELRQRTADLRDCISKLGEEFRDVVGRVLLGEDHGTIAMALGIPVGTSYSRLSKSKSPLKSCMEAKGWTA